MTEQQSGRDVAASDSIVDQLEDATTQATLMAASAILAGLRLEEDGIYRSVQKNMRKQEKLRAISYGMVCWLKSLCVELGDRSSYQILVPAKVSRTVSAGATS